MFLQENDNTDVTFLQDLKRNGKEIPWREMKRDVNEVAKGMDRAGYKKRAENMQWCAYYLKFGVCDNDHMILKEMKTCKDRLCPMCNFRRSKVLYKQTHRILEEALRRKPDLKFIFMGLTIKNPAGEALPEELNRMFEGMNRLTKYKEFDKAVWSWMRVFEITYNKKANTYHPHFHILIAVEPSYFGNAYIRQPRLVELWQRALGVEYKPGADIRMVKDKKKRIRKGDREMSYRSAIAETAKYAVKSKDILQKTEEATDRVIKVLAEALKDRRFIGYGKEFKTIRKELKLKDIEGKEADLVGHENESCNCPICGSGLMDEVYNWHVGFKNYVLKEV